MQKAKYLYISLSILLLQCIIALQRRGRWKKTTQIKQKPLKKWGSKKVLAFLSMHPIPNNIQIKPAHKTKKSNSFQIPPFPSHSSTDI